MPKVSAKASEDLFAGDALLGPSFTARKLKNKEAVKRGGLAL
jgi:hypothetical protein